MARRRIPSATPTVGLPSEAAPPTALAPRGAPPSGPPATLTASSTAFHPSGQRPFIAGSTTFHRPVKGASAVGAFSIAICPFCGSHESTRAAESVGARPRLVSDTGRATHGYRRATQAPTVDAAAGVCVAARLRTGSTKEDTTNSRRRGARTQGARGFIAARPARGSGGAPLSRAISRRYERTSCPTLPAAAAAGPTLIWAPTARGASGVIAAAGGIGSTSRPSGAKRGPGRFSGAPFPSTPSTGGATAGERWSTTGPQAHQSPLARVCTEVIPRRTAGAPRLRRHERERHRSHHDRSHHDRHQAREALHRGRPSRWPRDRHRRQRPSTTSSHATGGSLWGFATIYALSVAPRVVKVNGSWQYHRPWSSYADSDHSR